MRLHPEQRRSHIHSRISQRQGDHIVASKYIYGGSYNLLEHTLRDQGIETTFVDPDEEGSFEAAIRDNTKAVFIESIGNRMQTLWTSGALQRLPMPMG